MLGGLSSNFFRKMMSLEDSRRNKRVSSWDRSGGNRDFITIQPGEKAVLADIKGAGCINHIYFTILTADRQYLRKLLLRMYWDQEENPSVEVPFGDFFGAGHCRIVFFRSLMICVNEGAPGLTVGFNSYFPMPFSERAKIELLNESEFPMNAVWYHFDYEEYDELDENLGRFHAQWRRENPCIAVPRPEKGEAKNLTGKENYVILEAKGRGNYVGCILNVDNIVGGWWGEGDDMIFIDGEKWPPSLHGTGTEEIFGGGACPNREYAGPYTGFHLISNRDWSGKNSMYRFFVTDPIRFEKSIRVTLEHGHANDLANDYSSVAFWYQTEPHEPFPEMLSMKERLPRESEDYIRALKAEIEMRKSLFRPEISGRLSKEEHDKIGSLYMDIDEALNRDNPSKAMKSIEAVMKILEKYL